VQQRPQRGDVLTQHGHRGCRPGADLGHPVLHPVPDADDRPVAEHPVQRGDLHRGQRDVAERDGQDADAHPQPGGPGQGGRGRGDAAVEEAVLPQPELLEAGLVGGAGDAAQSLGRILR
jgi:hypothetical protein